MMTTLLERGTIVNISKMLRAAVCVCLAAYGTGALAAQSEAESREVLQHKLEEAQKRLDTAAREVAELSMSLSDGFVPAPPLPPPPPNSGFLGIVLAADGGNRTEGVEVASVSPGGGAAQAGIKPGDVLIQIDGESLAREGSTSPHEKLLAYMRTVKPDQKVKVRYKRGDKTHDAEVVARPMRNHVFTFSGAPSVGTHAFVHRLPEIGFRRADGVFGSAELVAITPKLGQYFGTDKGLLVVRAPDDSRLKIEEGDVILDIDGRVPSSPSHAFRILSSYQGGEKLKLSVLRQKKKLTFEIVIPEDQGRSEMRPGAFIEPARAIGAPPVAVRPHGVGEGV